MPLEVFLKTLSTVFSLKAMFLLAGVVLGSFLMKHVINYRTFFVFLDEWFFSCVFWVLGV